MEQTLYGLNKAGGFKIWSIETDEQGLITIKHGKEGGKLTIKSEQVKGKNIGRSNETTPAEQAVSEAESRVKTQMDKNYRPSKAELEEIPLLPMLAQDFRKHGSRIKFPCFGSPKLDGLRCLATCKVGYVELKSRTGQLYKVKHVQSDLLKIMEPGEVWDGELYIHGKKLQEIQSAVNKPNEDTPYLTFQIFDVVVADETYEERAKRFLPISFAIRRVEWIKVLPVLPIHDEIEMKRQHGKAVAEGYEGIMLRNYVGMYESGKRSADLQKYKEFLDEEFLIVGHTVDKEGCIVYICKNNVNDLTFNVIMGTKEEKQANALIGDTFHGKVLTVKFQSRYKGTLLPQFPVGVCFREGYWLDGEFFPTE